MHNLSICALHHLLLHSSFTNPPEVSMPHSAPAATMQKLEWNLYLQCFDNSPHFGTPLRPLTKHSEPANLVHEQCRDNIPRKYSQCPQEADEVDHVGTFSCPRHIELTPFLVV